MTDAPAQLAIGDTFQHYVVTGVLGEGGFARVYEVREASDPRPRALKVSHQAVGLGEVAQRALREVEVLRSLTNRHVVTIEAAGIATDGRVYIAMELLEGQALSEAHDADAPMSPLPALRLMHQAAMGLAEAHALGIVHRDLKPENLWVEPDGNLKVIDFGLARAWDVPTAVGANVTMGEVLVGTPHYMQPEQLQTRRLTPASDVYSLATILYELLTGRSVYFDDAPLSQICHRYRDEPVAWLGAHARATPIPLQRHPAAASLPASVIALVMACLAKDPSARPADGARLCRALGEILHYEFGVLPGTIVRIQYPHGTDEERLMLPGTHRVGTDPACELQLSGEGLAPIHALVEWDGPPDVPRVRALLDAAPVLVDGVRIVGAAQLEPDSDLRVGPFRLQLLGTPQA